MRDPVRVCLLNDHLGYGGTLHGVSRYFLEVVPRFDPSRVEPIVAILKRQEGLTRLFDERGIPVEFVGRSLADPLGLFGLLRLLRSRGVQVVHAQGYAATTLARIAKRRIGVRVVLHSHEVDDRYPMVMRLADAALAGSEDAALAVSEDARVFFEATRRIPAGLTRVVANGVDVAAIERSGAEDVAEVRRELRVPEGAPLVLCVTRFRPEKGNDVLIRAVPALRARVPDAVVAFAGEGSEIDACRGMATELGVVEALRFLGFRHDVARLVSAADVVSVPSRREGSPFFVLEALALGAPMVASRVGGLAAILEDGASARLVPSEDSEALAAALAELIEDPALRARLSAGARARAADYDVREHVALLTDLYGELAAGSETRSSR